jgi:hypothetical protein
MLGGASNKKFTADQPFNPMRPSWLQKKIALDMEKSENIKDMKAVVVDFSAHTKASTEGLLSPQQLALWESCHGYDAVVVTDVASCQNVKAVETAAADLAPGLVVLSGFRVSGKTINKKKNRNNFAMCVCGAEKVPMCARVAANWPMDHEYTPAMNKVSAWAIKNKYLVYSDKIMGCSKVFDPSLIYMPSYTVVYLPKDAETNEKTIIQAVQNGLWRKYKTPRKENLRGKMMLSKADKNTAAGREEFENKWGFVMEPLKYIALRNNTKLSKKNNVIISEVE